jgi:hypothetical protein
MLLYLQSALQERSHCVGSSDVHSGELTQAFRVFVDASEQRLREAERNLLCFEVLHRGSEKEAVKCMLDGYNR